MRRISGSRFCSLTLASWLAAGVFGCAGTTPVTTPEPAEPARSTPKSREVTPTRLAKGDDTGLDADAKSLHERMLEAMKEPPEKPEAAPKKADDGTIDWVGNDSLRTANPPRPEKPLEKPDAGGEKVPSDTGPAKPDDGIAKPTTPVRPQPVKAVTTEPDRDALLKLIRDRVKTNGDPAVAKAMSLAALALVDPSFKPDEKELAALPPTQRELVKQFLDLFATLAQQVQDGKSVDRAALVERMNAIVGEQPLSIRTIKLCDRVRGFGVYEELPGDTFLAGREQPMVVYVELDHFKSVKTGESHQVKLTQELVLYNESDGLAVWRQPEEQIVDESRNKRRDFYVVQPTRLPARLGVGKYVLKIRVRDVLGGTRDETSLPINVVADPALVKQGANKPG
jgi:hypothetical protein